MSSYHFVGLCYQTATKRDVATKEKKNLRLLPSTSHPGKRRVFFTPLLNQSKDITCTKYRFLYPIILTSKEILWYKMLFKERSEGRWTFHQLQIFNPVVLTTRKSIRQSRLSIWLSYKWHAKEGKWFGGLNIWLNCVSK